MNTLQFVEGKGLTINGRIIPDTNNHHFSKLAKRVKGEGVNIILTNEVALNGNVAGLDAMYGFRPSQAAAKAILTHGAFKNCVYAYRLLAFIRRFTGKVIGQSYPPTVLHHGEIIILVYSNTAQESGIDFMISYAAEEV